MKTNSPKPSNRYQLLLERLTALSLVAVVLSLVWIIALAYRPGWTWLRLASIETEIYVSVAIIVLSLALVSIVAFLHTKVPDEE